MQPFKIQIKLGQFEFTAEGEESSVKEQLASFMAYVNKAPSPPTFIKQPQINPKDQNSVDDNKDFSDEGLSADFAKVFSKERDLLTLRIHPEEKNGSRTGVARESFVLLLYGFKKMLNKEDPSTMFMADGLRKSGIPFNKIAELADPLYDEGLITKTGKLKGTKYRLTNKGVTAAEKLIEELRPRF